MVKDGKVNVSIIIPAKDEEKILWTTLQVLKRLGHEMIVVLPPDDGGLVIAKENAIAIVCHGKTKGSAVNTGLLKCKGNVVGIYDADSRPEKNAIEKLVDEITRSDVSYGRIKIHETGLVERIGSIEYNYTFLMDGILQKFNIPTLLHGTNYFIKKELATCSEDKLTEDVDLSLRLIKKGKKVTYISEAVAWQESPSKLSVLLRQRKRWMRGLAQVLFTHRIPLLTAIAYSFLPVISILILITLVLQPVVSILLFGLLLFILSVGQITAKSQIKDVILSPILVGIYGIVIPILFFVGFADEILNRPVVWFKTPRNG
ncbi:MAG: glycosyltransferase family 2 protein [Candidatus Micrarchaeota archaeon]